MMTQLQAIRRIVVGILLPVVILANAATVYAQSADQQALYQEQILSYDATYQACSATTAAAGVTGGGNATVTTDLASFVDAYGKAAFDVGKANGIPYDAILAQASLESNNGQSQLNKQAFNFFGIKAGSDWTGPTVTMRTAEQTSGGSVYYVNAQFEAFPNAQAGFQGYVDFLKRYPRYATALQQRDPVAYFQALKAAGYATDVNYVNKLTSRLTAVQTYIASKNLFPPSSQVQYDVQPATGAASTAAAPAGGSGCSGASAAAGSVVAVALQEAQAWQQGTSTYKKYTNGRPEDWCADFVSWVYNTAGKPFTPTPGVPMTNGWQIPAVSGVRTYLQTKGQFWPKATAPAPQPGDIVIYENGASHTNIVVEANGYMVKTVGGNQDGGNGQGAYFMTSRVSESPTAFDIRNDPTVTGWGRLP